MWPADEYLVIEKINGLQLKKVDYKTNVENHDGYRRLNWTFHNPVWQLNLALKVPEIFY